MTEEERDNLIDQLPDDMTLWPDDEEAAGPWSDHTFEKWRDILGHPRAHQGCCATCGCCAPCVLDVFHDAVVESVIRELGRMGALKQPESAQ